jgi:hypothetical protein
MGRLLSSPVVACALAALVVSAPALVAGSGAAVVLIVAAMAVAALARLAALHISPQRVREHGPPAVGIGLLIAAAFLTPWVIGMGGCASTSTRQDIAGQATDDSPQSKASFVDNPDGSGTGTSTFTATGPIEVIRQESGRTDAKSSGLVPRTLVAEKDAATGSLRVTLRSGSDAEGEFAADPATGNLTSFRFKTSSSAPLDALGRADAVLQPTFQRFSSDRRAQVERAIQGLETVFPELAAVAKAAIGLP